MLPFRLRQQRKRKCQASAYRQLAINGSIDNVFYQYRGGEAESCNNTTNVVAENYLLRLSAKPDKFVAVLYIGRVAVTKLTFEIPDATHHLLKIQAAVDGLTIKDFILNCIAPELTRVESGREQLRRSAEAWEMTRQNLTLERGDKSYHEIIHDGHKW